MHHIQLRASLPRSRVVKYRKSRREADVDDAAIFELYAVHKEVTALQKVAGVSSVPYSLSFSLSLAKIGQI